MFVKESRIKILTLYIIYIKIKGARESNSAWCWRTFGQSIRWAFFGVIT